MLQLERCIRRVGAYKDTASTNDALHERWIVDLQALAFVLLRMVRRTLLKAWMQTTSPFRSPAAWKPAISL